MRFVQALIFVASASLACSSPSQPLDSGLDSGPALDGAPAKDQGVDGGETPIDSSTQDAVSDSGPSDSGILPDAMIHPDAMPLDSGPQDSGIWPDAAPPFLPRALSGLELWLDSTRGVTVAASGVSGWGDQSGKQHDALQPTPTARCGTVAAALNAMPIVSCARAGSWLMLPSTPAYAAGSAFTVYRNTATLDYGAHYYVPLGFGANADVVGHYMGVQLGSVGGENNTPNRIEIFAGFENDGVASATGIGASGPTAPFQILDWVSPSAGRTTVFTNGSTAAMSYQGSDAGWVLSLGSGSTQDFGGVGTNPFFTANYSAEDPEPEFAEILFYSRTLSASERQRVEGYLAWKWGLASALPANHPYKARAP